MQEIKSSMRKRVGYCVENDEGKFDISIHSEDFSEPCYQELNDYSKVIFDLKPIVTAFEAVKNNHEAISGSITSHENSLRKIKIPTPEAFQQSLDNMAATTQIVTNLLTSASFFLTSAEIRLRRMFGSSSDELFLWNEYRRDLHCESFSYRFMYELRNYSQHYGLPISGFNASLTDMLSNKPSTEIIIYLSKDELLKDNFKWGSLRKDIEKLEVKNDIIPYIDAYFEILKKLFVKYLDIYEKELLECHKYISTFHKIFGIPEGTTPMLFLGEGTKDQPVPKNVEYIPTDQFIWVCRKYMALKNMN